MTKMTFGSSFESLISQGERRNSLRWHSHYLACGSRTRSRAKLNSSH